LLQRRSLGPAKYAIATSLEAISDAAISNRKKTLFELAEKYGNYANIDRIQCDEMRLAIKIKIFMAWKNRHKISSVIIAPIDCYQRKFEIYEDKGIIEVGPAFLKDCVQKCELISILRNELDSLKKMRNAISNLTTNEQKRQNQALKKIINNPRMTMDHKTCRNLGDIVFALLCPPDSIILTTNTKDHQILADSLGKKASSPSEVLSEGS
jgi:hypothetical protein